MLGDPHGDAIAIGANNLALEVVPRRVDERTVNFYADYNGVVVHAVATIENCNDGSCALDNSLIQEMVIRPA